MIGLFTERAYCRFLCPLGGVLALADRLHLVDLLKRRPRMLAAVPACISEEDSCPVSAISVTGKINTTECFQCLDCQVEYFDDRRCPPLAAIRKTCGRRTGTARYVVPAGAKPRCNPREHFECRRHLADENDPCDPRPKHCASRRRSLKIAAVRRDRGQHSPEAFARFRHGASFIIGSSKSWARCRNWRFLHDDPAVAAVALADP